MGRTKISAGRMAREPSVPKLIAISTSPPTTTIESTPSSPSQPPSSPSAHHLVTLLHPPSQLDRRSPSLPPSNRPPESTKNNPSSSPPPKPDAKKKANKPRPEPKTRPLTLRSGKKIAAPPLTRAQAKLGILENTPQTQGKQQEPPVIRPHDTDQPEPSRRRAAPRNFFFPAPKRKKARMASGASSLPPDNLHFPKAKMQLRIRPNLDKAPQNKKKTKPKHEKTVKMKKKTKPKHEKTVKMKKKTKPKHEKTVKTKKKTEVDEVIEDVVSSHSNDDISSLHTNVNLLTTVVLVNNTMLKEQQAQLNRLETMVQTRYRGL